MENKPTNVFEKLDKQGEQIEDISGKLEGISINDLYALAKRTWEYGDYTTAQKYYNHISLLKPLDWEAPLMSSLCNFRDRHEVIFWEDSLIARKQLFIATIEYILNLELDEDKKNVELKRCIGIITDNIDGIFEQYYDNKNVFDRYGDNYNLKLEMFLIDTYNGLSKNDNEKLIEFFDFLFNKLLDIISQEKIISQAISKDLFLSALDRTKREIGISYEELSENSKSLMPKEKLSEEEIKNIKLNGKLCYEYTDKVISKRRFRGLLTTGLVLLISAIVGAILCVFIEWYYSLVFAIPFLYGIMILAMAIAQKDIINLSSILSPRREGTRLSSNGNVVTDNKFNFVKLMSIIGLYLILFTSLGIIIGRFTNVKFDFRSIIIVILSITIIVDYFLYFIKYSYAFFYKSEGEYKYLYKGKYYKL